MRLLHGEIWFDPDAFPLCRGAEAEATRCCAVGVSDSETLAPPTVYRDARIPTSFSAQPQSGARLGGRRASSGKPRTAWVVQSTPVKSGGRSALTHARFPARSASRWASVGSGRLQDPCHDFKKRIKKVPVQRTLSLTTSVIFSE